MSTRINIEYITLHIESYELDPADALRQAVNVAKDETAHKVRMYETTIKADDFPDSVQWQIDVIMKILP